MEPQSVVCAVQSGAWKQFLPIGPGGDLRWRDGQMRTWDVVAGASMGDCVFSQLPTGYGKTVTICGSYVILNARRIADRLLVLVPSDALREQMVPTSRASSGGLLSTLRSMGHEARGLVAIEKSPRDLRYAESRSCDVFVASYQQAITDEQFWSRLLSHGKWMIACDEAHHLTSNTWGQSVQRMPAAFRLMLSATPVRTDKRGIVGLEEEIGEDGARRAKPHVLVTLEEARKEGAIRRPIAHIHHYFVDVKKPGEDAPVRITTSSLREEGVTDFSEYETKTQLRYASKYLSRLLIDAYNDWCARELRYPGMNQILVFAMTNAHASAVSEQLTALAPDLRVDWIGQARPERENKDILERFKRSEIDCLVQVNKAGEGFDNNRLSVLVFLHLVGSPSTLIQQIGRGLRRNYSIPADMDTVSIFASADTPVAEMVLDLDAACSDPLPAEKQATTDEPKQLSLGLADIPSRSLRVVDVELDRVDLVTGGDVVDRSLVELGRERVREAGADPSLMTEQSLAKLGAMFATGRKEPTPAAQEFASESGALAFWQKSVKTAVGTLASNVLKFRGDGSFERSLMGDIIRSVHAQWKRISGRGHDTMTAVELEQKYEWIRSVNEAIKSTGEVPSWLSK